MLRAAVLPAALREGARRGRARLGPLLRQHSADLVLDVAPLDNVGGGWSLGLVSVQKVPAQLPQLLRIVLGHLRRRPAGDLLHERLDVLGIERHAERCHLVGDATQGPDVAAEGVRLLLADLRGEVVRSPDGRARTVLGVLQHAGNPEVSHLHRATAWPGQEDVLRLEVAVDDVPVVQVLQRQGCLGEPPQHVSFRKKLAAAFLAVDHAVEVALLRIVGDNAQQTVAHVRLPEGDDERVAELGQDLDLVGRLIPLLRRHLRNVDLLEDALLT
mmetsp:Transcript_91424/g.282798  ORF Transcript_91424/g.282798 Transcript_91424/m.282798 type:complete len:272 (+) Transcript_91424:1-816(+)